MNPNDFKPAAEPWESPDDLKAFQKRLVLHVLVMDNYALVNRRNNRLEFNGAITAANIETIIAAIRDELNEHFIMQTDSHQF